MVYFAGRKKAETLAPQGFRLFLEINGFVAYERNKLAAIHGAKYRLVLWNIPGGPAKMGSQKFDA